MTDNERIRALQDENESLHEAINEWSGWLAKCRDIILDNHNHGGISDDFYDYWMPQTVPDPSLVPNMVQAEIERLETKYYTKKSEYEKLQDDNEQLRKWLLKIQRYTREEDPTNGLRKAHFAHTFATIALEGDPCEPLRRVSSER